jgi:hypothetical protein
MADDIRLKRRTTGNAGAPSQLRNAEPAYNEVDDVLYIGVGLGQDGYATTIKAIAGAGVFALKTYVDSAISNANLSNYLTTSAAASTYLSQATAASTYATQSSVSTAISNVINAAPAALDTLKELADALGSDASFSTTVTTSIASKADRTLSNLTDAAAARTNLGLGSMATQSAGSVAITGGTIDGVTLDGGSF